MLNYSATELAVRPLESMFSIIKSSARSIFSSVSSLSDEDDKEETLAEEDMDKEIALLEKVVAKIAVLAQLTNQEDKYDEETMENMGIPSVELGLLGKKGHSGKTLNASEAPQQNQKGEFSVTMQWQLEEIGISYDCLNSWDLNVLDLRDDKQEQLSNWILMHNRGCSEFTEENVDIKTLRSFVEIVHKGYQPNPYHNFFHAVDVLHTVYRYFDLMAAEHLFLMVEQFAILVSALCHDLGHIGLNNPYLIETQHELAIQYNDRSPLENLHCCKLFEILTRPTLNVFSSVTQTQFRDVRKMMISIILHTDIAKHPAMVKELENLYEMNSKVFEASSKDYTKEEIELLTTSANKTLLAELALHAADISNPTKPFEISKAWAWRVLDECFAQGDQERQQGIPLQMLNDRNKVNKPFSQIGFIEFIITPLVVAEVKLFPSLYEISVLLEENSHKWERAWVEESTPDEAAREGAAARIQNIVTLLDNKGNQGPVNRWKARYG